MLHDVLPATPTLFEMTLRPESPPIWSSYGFGLVLSVAGLFVRMPASAMQAPFVPEADALTYFGTFEPSAGLSLAVWVIPEQVRTVFTAAPAGAAANPATMPPAMASVLAPARTRVLRFNACLLGRW